MCVYVCIERKRERERERGGGGGWGREREREREYTKWTLQYMCFIHSHTYCYLMFFVSIWAEHNARTCTCLWIALHFSLPITNSYRSRINPDPI